MPKDRLQSSLRKCEDCGVIPQRREASVGGSVSGKEALKATVRGLGSVLRSKVTAGFEEGERPVQL